MSQFLKLISKILILGCFTSGCSSQPQQVPTNIPRVDLIPLSLGILTSEEINTSGSLKVNDGLIISDRSDCLPKDCAFSIWDVLEQDTLALTVSNSTIQLAISLRSFQTSDDATAYAEKIFGENAGQPGIQMIEIPIELLPEQSWAYAEDGRLVHVSTVYGNIQIGISFSQYTGGMNDPEKAAVILANVAKMQIDKLTLLSSR